MNQPVNRVAPSSKCHSIMDFTPVKTQPFNHLFYNFREISVTFVISTSDESLRTKGEVSDPAIMDVRLCNSIIANAPVGLLDRYTCSDYMSAVIRWNGHHSRAFKIERGVRQGCILSPHLFNLYTESVEREAGIKEMGIKIGGKLVSNLRYADDTALCANLQEEAERLIRIVNNIGKAKLLKLNVKKTKLLKIGKMQ